MSGTRRIPIQRRRLPHVAPAALALFVQLDQVPRRRRNTPTFEASERELARLLGLSAEWWTGNSVLDRSDGPCHSPGYLSHDDWFRVRAVREALLLQVAAV